MTFLSMSKIQKKDHARILRGALPAQVLKRLAEAAKVEAAALAQAAADKARSVEEAAAEYARTLPERIKAEQQKRFLSNVARINGTGDL